VKITYPLATIWAARAEAEDNGHRFKGTARKCGLSFALTCTQCKRSAVITPAWYPWERDKIITLPDACATRGA
jgi:hypothetical protein